MDLFVEQIVSKKKSTRETVLQVFIWWVSLMIAIVLIYLIFAIRIGGIFLFVALIGEVFGAYKLSSKFNIEYEYAITNGYFDVDKIIAKSKRQRVLSTTCRDFESFGKFDAKEHANKSYKTRIIACTENAEGQWYAAVNTKDTGYTIVVFTPNEKVLNALKKYVPRQVAGDAFRD